MSTNWSTHTAQSLAYCVSINQQGSFRQSNPMTGIWAPVKGDSQNSGRQLTANNPHFDLLLQRWLHPRQREYVAILAQSLCWDLLHQSLQLNHLISKVPLCTKALGQESWWHRKVTSKRYQSSYRIPDHHLSPLPKFYQPSWDDSFPSTTAKEYLLCSSSPFLMPDLFSSGHGFLDWFELLPSWNLRT